MLTGTSVATTNMATSARIEISSGDIAAFPVPRDLIREPLNQ